VLIPIAGGGTVPLGQVAKVSLAQGPSSIRTENAQLALTSMSTYAIVTLVATSPTHRKRWRRR
jgi:Cu/Ag efflux pump CusA